MISSICTNPDVLNVMLILNNFFRIATILLPLILIGKTTIDLLKLIKDGEYKVFRSNMSKLLNSLIAGAIIFFIPTIVDVMFGFIDSGVSVTSCFTNVTESQVEVAYIRQAELLVTRAEASLEQEDYSAAYTTVLQIDDEMTRTNYKARLEAVLKTIQARQNYTTYVVSKNEAASSNTGENISSSGKLEAVGSFYSTGNGKATVGYKLSYEPDPSAAINYWSSLLNSDDYIYPKDQTTGESLGAWPKNYRDIPTQLSNYKTYKNGVFIFPVTPVGGTYSFVYEHNGIDIMTTFATPVYSPVDGTVMYSEWGHTVNKGGDETAYTVSIRMDEAVTISGKKIDTVFLTHMCGIVFRCKEGSCNKTVKKGELVGFTGNAAGSAESVGWAPHLHMTLYPKGVYNNGLTTTTLQTEIYGIPSGTSVSIKAGG